MKLFNVRVEIASTVASGLVQAQDKEQALDAMRVRLCESLSVCAKKIVTVDSLKIVAETATEVNNSIINFTWGLKK